MNNRFELLAPAGSYETFKAVINAGADAVYLAGSMFGARAYASNLSGEELIQAIDYAHIHGRKVYLTVNTLLKNNEINNDLHNYLKPLYEAGLDAVIVQDYGVMKYIHTVFPEMEIHASTQMTVTSPEYGDFLKKYGVTRIVPARELSLDEIKSLHDATGLETECFIHGALCYCYSGMCLMSSFIGGRSGNRGRCAQPCRLEYEKDGIKSGLLSLKDLCTTDILPDILEAGVYSLKIEGRMKSPEYAAGVTSIYRKYLDMYIEKGRSGYRTDKKDIERLLMLFDRGGITDGYYKRHNGKNMIADAVKTDKSQEDKKLFEEYIRKNYIEKDIKLSLNGTVTLSVDSPAVLTIWDENNNYVSVSGNNAEKSVNAPITHENVSKQISKLGGTPFKFEHLDVIIENGIYYGNRQLNELRRKAIEEYNTLILEKYRRKSASLYSSERMVINSYSGISIHVMNIEQAEAAAEYDVRRIIMDTEIIQTDDMISFIELCHCKKIECFIGMPRIVNKYDSFINNNIRAWVEKGIDGFLIRNVSQAVFLRNSGYTGSILSDFSCYAYNDIAAEVLEENGITGMVCSVELNEKELRKLNTLSSELIIYGRIPLMISANCIEKTTGKCNGKKSRFTHMRDRKNAVLPVLTACRYCYNIIYNSVPVYLADKTYKELNISYGGVLFTDESADIVRRIMDDITEGRQAEFAFTRGHFTRGVE